MRNTIPDGAFVVDSKGKKIAVILPIEQFVEMSEDLHDLRIVAERRDEKTITAKKLAKRIQKRGFV